MIDDIERRLIEDERTWNAQNRIGTVEYDAETDTIAFLRDKDDKSEDYFYWFPLKEVKTYQGYNHWFEHLGHKRWFTPDVRFNLLLVLERLGYDGSR